MTLVWNNSLETGIDVIDNQHRRIVAYINTLDQARMTGDAKRVNSVIEQLVDYTQSHFGFEEALMEEAGYKFLMPHKKVHELFIRRVAGFTARAAKGEDIAEELQRVLSTWLLNHIAGEDNDYADTVKRMTGVDAKPAAAVVLKEKKRGLLARFFGSADA